MGLCVFSLFVSCSPRPLHEARSVVAEADSLWLEGGLYSDSAQLAQAYTTLEHWQRFYADDYAHACYHYGKLLRKHEDPVSAMQVFINATHSPSHDYHILGRVYSNMGSICHLADAFSLSYEMYALSTDMFQHNGDTLAYFYGLNDMALEKAMLVDINATSILLDSIEHFCKEDYVLAKACETRAEMFLRSKQYDSAIHYAHKSYAYGYNDPTGWLIIAQSFSHISNKDSATYYAEKVASQSASLRNLNNALYILTNDDEAKDITAIRKTAADRADAQKLLEIRQGKFSQAVQLLEQDLNRTPNMQGWLIIIIFVLTGSIAFLVPYLVKKHAKQISSLSEKQVNNTIVSIKKHINTTDINKTLHWKDYNAMKSEADLYMNGIASKLEMHNLNETEIRFCILTILDFPLKKIADTIYYSYPSGIKTLKKRISDKLGTKPPHLKEFLLRL